MRMFVHQQAVATAGVEQSEAPIAEPETEEVLAVKEAAKEDSVTVEPEVTPVTTKTKEHTQKPTPTVEQELASEEEVRKPAPKRKAAPKSNVEKLPLPADKPTAKKPRKATPKSEAEDSTPKSTKAKPKPRPLPDAAE